MPNIEITGYDPTKYGMDEQTVNIKFSTPLGTEIEDSFKVRQIYKKSSVWNYNIIDNNIELTSFKDTDFSGNRLYIPKEIDGHNVVAIADSEDSLFKNNESAFENISELYLPSSLTKIGKRAFYNLNGNLDYIKSDADSIEIGDEAFYYVESLMTLDADISYVGNKAFYYAENLKNIKFSNSLSYIGDQAFMYALHDASLTIPNSLTNIGNEPFRDSDLKEVVFDNNVETIYDYMFYDCNNLEKVILPNNLKKIGNYAFYYAFKISPSYYEIVFPKSITLIGENNFKGINFAYTKLLVYNNTYTKTYFNNNNILYKQIDPSFINVSGYKPKYKAFENIHINDLSIELIYNEITERKENIDENIKIEYQNEMDSFRYGDTSFKVSTYNSSNYKIEKEIKVEVEKAIPSYSKPNNLVAKPNMKLSEVTLPDGFEWMDENQTISEIGEQTFYAKYIPDDTYNYEIVENIEITINVVNTVTVTFNSNDETNQTKTQDIQFNTDTKLDKNTFTRDGYDFVEWNTKDDGTGESYTDEQTVNIGENLILYAKWKESFTYKINKYLVDEDKRYISKIDIYTPVNVFVNNILTNNGYSFNVDTKQVNNQNVLYTGGKTRILKDGKPYVEYTNIVTGDTNGDGKITYLDYVKIYNHIQKEKHPESDKNQLENEYLIAGDLNEDNKITYLDYVKIYNTIKEFKGGTN